MPRKVLFEDDAHLFIFAIDADGDLYFNEAGKDGFCVLSRHEIRDFAQWLLDEVVKVEEELARDINNG